MVMLAQAATPELPAVQQYWRPGDRRQAHDDLPPVSYWQIQPGLPWRFSQTALDREALYHGDMSPLFRLAPNDFNGLTNYANAAEINSILQWNAFRQVTEFYVDGLFGERPAGVPPEIIPALEEAVRCESRHGQGILIAQRRMGMWPALDAVCPVYARPISDRSGYRHIGMAIGYPHRSYAMPAHAAGAGSWPRPDQLEIYIWIPAYRINEWRLYQYDGAQLGALLTSSPVTDLMGIWTFGRGQNDYAAMTPIVREICVRMSAASRVLNRHTNPSITGPPLHTNPGGRPPPTDGVIRDMTTGSRQNTAWHTGGNYFEVTGGNAVIPQYLVWDGNLEANFRHIRELLGMLERLTGVPMTTDSPHHQAPASGEARRVDLWSAVSHLRRLQQDVERVLASIAAAGLGIPVRPDQIRWELFPLETESSKANTMISLVQAGILDGAQARELLFGPAARDWPATAPEPLALPGQPTAPPPAAGAV